MLRLSACRLQTPAQRPKAPFYEPVATGVVRCSPILVYPKHAAHLKHYLGPEIRALVAMQLLESSVSGHNLKYQLPSDRRGLLVRDGEALEPFCKVASHHEAVLVPCRSDRVGSGDVHCQPLHRNTDDVLVQRLWSSPPSL